MSHNVTDARIQQVFFVRSLEVNMAHVICLLQEKSNGPDLSGLNLYLELIYKKHMINTNYDCIHPVHLDPADATRYILLTPGNMEVWAQALVSDKYFVQALHLSVLTLYFDHI